MSAPDSFPELAEKLRVIRERIRKRLERTSPPLPEVQFPSLEPLKEQQSTARHWAAAIGTVNPRPPGLVNELIQSSKRALARISEWQLRPQREFNQNVAESLAKIADVLEVTNRNFVALQEAWEHSGRIHQELGRELDSLCEQITLQRWAYEGALMRQTNSVQQLEEEMRLLRQRVAAQAKAQATRSGDGASTLGTAGAGGPSRRALEMDYFQLERHFRGTEEEIRARQSFYLPFFQGRRSVLDMACGRGEFLELMREAQVPARGVDLDADMAGCCLEKGLEVVQADVFEYLESVPEGALDGIFSAQFVEHLEPEAYMRLIAQCAGKLAPRGVLAIETQNPECLAIFSQTFFLDPTHVQPIPPAQLRFLFAEAGLERITTHFLSPAGRGLPVVPQLASQVVEAAALRTFNAAVARFNETFFGGMDYAVIGYRPGAAPA